MKIKFNYFFFIFLFLCPLIGALIALPYGLFIASTPYYFSWPFESFWQEFFVLVTIIIFLYSLLVAYMALPWLAVIREDRITFHRLFRRRLVIPLDKVKNTEVVSKNLPVKEYLWGIGSVSFKMRDGDEWLVSGISHSIILKIYEILEKKGIKWVELNRKLTEKEKESLQKRGY